MRTSHPSALAASLLLALLMPPLANAAIITNDTTIGVTDTTYDGQDLVVSNAVLTVDGPHAFNSLRLAAGATLTHSGTSNGSVPFILTATNEFHVLDGTNATGLFKPNVIFSSVLVQDTNYATTFTNEVDYTLTSDYLNQCLLSRTAGAAIPDGSGVFVSYDYTATTNTGMNLTLTNDFELEPGASVDLVGRGRSGGVGGGSSGSGPSGGGGGHGGLGGISSGSGAGGSAYDSALGPVEPGYGGGAGSGGPGALGGGVMRLIVGGNCVLNGTVTADGLSATNSRAGGGAGGGVWITAPTISGNGSITANGGAGEPVHGGGGGGGRIALDFTTNLFTGNLTAFGGNGWQRGGAGTILLRTNATTGVVTFDNGGVAGAATPLSFTSAAALIVQGCANVTMASSQNLTSLLVRSNSSLTTSATNDATLALVVQGDAVVEAGALLTVQGRGSSQNIGTGVGASSGTVGSGAGHGGYGGSGISGTTMVAGGNYYGSITGPTTLGSGGRSVGSYFGGAGGGAVRLTVTGNLQLDGKVSADATAGGVLMGGGGSGGSVWLTLGTFAGSGSISANGGSGGTPGNGGGGGSGGRIAVTFNTNLFTGNLTAFGGTGGVPGGAGTIYTKLNSANYADLRYDNNGLAGTNAMMDASIYCNLMVTGAAALRSSITSAMSFAIIHVASNSCFLLNNTGGGVHVSTNLTIAAGGLITADGLGATSGSGNGPGGTSILGSGGAGHGGTGGRGQAGAGGVSYDSTSVPSLQGSGGGSSTGGAGGGILNITCSGLCHIDGRLSANGLSTSTNFAGGGSGGTVRLALSYLTGTGLIAADGGNGHLPYGGGGGGGRIAITRISPTFTSSSFMGNFSAKGGLGYNPGGAGTIFLMYSPYPNLIVDNGGMPGSNSWTSLDISTVSNLIVRGGTLTSAISPITIYGKLDMQSGAKWVTPGQLTILGSANIADGASVLAEAVSSSGPGSGTLSSGGGYGGYGGRSFSGNGGNTYDTYFGTIGPTQWGSPGGYIGFPPRYGGGAIRMTVSGPFTNNGRISVNGDSATTNTAGGGSGGSVYLTINNLFTGSGSITADGGTGFPLTISGGGGGGRIAIHCHSNTYTGTLSAKGGNGFQAGGAGTIYLKARPFGVGDFIADNGGLVGTNTPLDNFVPISSLTITGGAIVRPSTANSISVVNLLIGTNSSLQMPTAGGGLALTISGSANVAAGGSITADGQGNPSGTGSGFGGGSPTGSGGAGYAGYGGRGADSSSAGWGGSAYGSLTSPTSFGSGGGGTVSAGGAGGGAIRITVSPLSSALFTLNGKISANGFNAYSNNAGGGSGGSVHLSLNQLIGNGSITANGGDGNLPNGGGGGGGRVSVSYAFVPSGQFFSNAFTGTFSARGGNGYQRGGAGTIWLRTNYASTAVVFVDNGGSRGTNTLVSGTSGHDLFVQGGGIATSLGTPRDLFVLSNSFVAQTGSLSVSRDATLDAGGGINLDGLGNYAGGNGSSFSTPKGGAGHGGYGALNPGNAGGAYDSAISPSLAGSQGGNGSGSGGLAPYGGLGGGALQLTVGNTLLVNGEISADGLNGDLNSGGGSGGGLRLQTLTLAGSGEISARGGNGNGAAGGGGGGRIALYYTSNLFTGTLSACGGSGGLAGGAGTIYVRDGFARTSLLLDNCGLAGTNTPLSTSSGLATDISVTGGAVGEFQGVIPAFSNLVISAGSGVTMRSADTNLYLALLGDLTVAGGARIFTDGKGFAYAAGPGAGTNLSFKGSGGGYGGEGGASASGALGGITYGSAAMPEDRGSGGGTGLGLPASSEGGGAIRLAVAGTLLNDGSISANGATGLQDDSGGGSGGSVWIAAGKISGGGALAANGGDGDLFGGGGGGGGRIALYSPMNTFTGLVAVAGGYGALNGGTGTVFTTSSLLGLDVIAQTPTGVVSDAVSQVTLQFTDAVNPASVGADDFKLYTPYGLLDASNFTFAFPAPATVRVSFPTQNVPGAYRFETGPGIESLFGLPMSQVFTGAFTATMPLLTGTVTDTNGAPVAGVTLQPGGGLIPATTDASGNYSLGVPLNWSGTVTPTFGDFMFAPGVRGYTNVTADVADQNYLMVATIAASLNGGVSGTNLVFNWSGLAGVTYQLYSATNLMVPVWLPLGLPVPGTNGLMQLEVPIGSEPELYFRLGAQN